MSLFLTGTDTGVGKTYTASALLRLARASGLRCAGFKPICCGDRQDAEHLLAASSDGLTLDEVNPIWLKTPASPYTASIAEDRQFEAAPLIDGLAQLQERFDFVVVEGVGGWLVPIRRDYFVCDLAREMELPVVVVALNRLGCLNHTLLTVRAVAATGLQCAGLVLNERDAASDTASATNGRVLREILEVPILPSLAETMADLPAEWQTAVSNSRRRKPSPIEHKCHDP